MRCQRQLRDPRTNNKGGGRIIFTLRRLVLLDILLAFVLA
jgi:hypothetical protein